MNEVRLIDANALNYKNLAEVNGRLTYVLTAEEIDNAPTIPLRLMTVEECAGHTIDYAMGWKACIEWIKKGGVE